MSNDKYHPITMKKLKWDFEWNEGISVGIPEIDEDHKRFISLVDELNRSITDRMKAVEIKKRLQIFVKDAERHFAQEEKIFREWQYPDFEKNARSHNQVLNLLESIQDSFMPYGLEAEWIEAARVIKSILISPFILKICNTRNISNQNIKMLEYFKLFS